MLRSTISLLSAPYVRSLATVQVESTMKRPGNISDVFTSLSGGEVEVLPPRFSDLKKELWNNRMKDAWNEVLAELRGRTKEIARMGSRVRPHVLFRGRSA